MVNSRLGNGVYDYESSGDNMLPDSDKTGILYETCATLNDTWGYKTYDESWKNAEQVKALKEHINSMGPITCSTSAPTIWDVSRLRL